MEYTKVGCSGTLGDTLCSIIKLNGAKRLYIQHFTKHRGEFAETIRNLYSLIGPKRVEIVSERSTFPRIHSDFVGEDEIELNYDPFPKFVESETLPGIVGTPKYRYVAVNPGSGKESEDRNIPDLDTIIKQNRINGLFTLLLGTKPIEYDYKYMKRNLIVNMIGRTNILDAFKLVNYCHSFIGYQGILAFYAMSQRRKTTIYLKRHEKEAVNCRTHPLWMEYRTLKEI